MVENPNFSQPEPTVAVALSLLQSKDELDQEIAGILEGLSHKESRVLQLGFGLEDGKAKTPAEIGEIVGRELRGRPYSSRWIKRIEARALNKLRHPVMSGPELGAGSTGAEIQPGLSK